MTQESSREALNNHIRHLADSKCKNKHPELYEALTYKGPGDPDGLGPPCSDCLGETQKEYEAKRAKAHGQVLTPEEAAEIRKKLGL